ncbi:cAMP-dependent protein kinase type II regulatory subunit [Pelomyxa schiedti]|nr:cAMP-dependent protein kinase type II regulatory subunit [Pelomyxa schiedti]
MVDAMYEKETQPGEVVIHQGDTESNEFFVVTKGSFSVIVSGTKVTSLGEGRSFGEIALLYDCPRTATVKSEGHGTLWVMDRLTFRQILMGAAIQKRKRFMYFLNRVPLLSPMTECEKGLIADALEHHAYKAGEYILRQGDVGDRFYVVEKGVVAVTLNIPRDDGAIEEVPVKELTEGDYFGELALITKNNRAANILALSDSVEVVSLTGRDFSLVIGNAAVDRLLRLAASERLAQNTDTYSSSPPTPSTSASPSPHAERKQ